MMIQLAPVEEERAHQLAHESLIFVCHDHNLAPEDMEAMRRGGVTAKQVHISLDAKLWADKEIFEASATQEEGYLRRAMVALDYIYWQVEHSQGRLVIAWEPEDIVRAKANGSVSLVLGAEGSRLLEGRLETLRMLYRLGLRSLQLSWSFITPVGASQRDLSGRGLEEYGRKLIREMNRLGMMVDVSHLSYQSMLDAIETSTTPILNSHTGALALNPGLHQLLPDDMIQAIAAQGGILGIHFMSILVKPGPQKATFQDLMRQFEYLIRLAGVDHVACGPDYFPLSDPRMWENTGYPPYTFAEGVEDISQVQNVIGGLIALGLNDDDVRKIMGGNLLRLFRQVRAAAQPGPWEYIPYAAGLGACTDGVTPL
jgi:membrane dipeptidase